MLRHLVVIALAAAACAPSSAEHASVPTQQLQQAASPLQYTPFGPPVSGSAATGAQFGASLALMKSSLGLNRGELVVGAPGMSNNAGAVFIFTRATLGGALVSPAYSPLTGLTGSTFGTALATGDVNGDRLEDLIIGAPGGVGYVEVHLGLADGGLDSNSINIPAPGNATGFGSVIAVGDVNNDGKSDIAVAALSGDVAVYFLPSGAPILLNTGPLDSVLMVNLDADGGDELLVGAASAFTVLAFAYDGDAGIQALATRTPSPEVMTYGQTLTSWQNAGAPAQVMVSAPREMSAGLSVGATFTMPAASLLAPATDPGIELVGSTIQGLFGAALANVGRVNGDPTDDIFIGAPGLVMTRGSVYLYSTGTEPASLEWEDTRGGPDDAFGAAVAGGLSIDSNSSIDLIVGAPFADAGVGQIYVYFGSTSIMVADAGIDCVNPCAPCTACIEGACVPVAVDPACTGGTFCNPFSCSDAGTCIAPDFCTYGCSETEAKCYLQNQAVIVDDASRTATVGLPYQYNQMNTVTVDGTGPFAIASCGSPTGFQVVGGVVSWTPDTAGTAHLCIKASNAIGEDQLEFDVAVSPAGTAPMAILQVMPTSGPGPLHVQVDGTMSQSATQWTWDFGDMSSTVVGPVADHEYLLPGSYPVTLTVSDGTNRSSARQIVTVLDSAGNTPPTVTLVADPNGSAFSCDAGPGSSDIVAYAWDFEDRTVMTGPQLVIPQGYSPGLHRLRVRVIDQNGLAGNNATFFEGAPSSTTNADLHCRLSVDPPAGDAPLQISWSSQADQPGATLQLTVGQSTPADVTTPIAQSCTTPGVYRARLDATSSNNVGCTDFAYATATSVLGQVPVISPIDTALTMACTGTFHLQPIVTGTRPIIFTLQGPAGAQVDAATGKVTWQAPLVADYQLTATNDAGSTTVDFSIDYSCDDVTDGGVVPPSSVVFHTTPCGCGSSDASAFGLAALLVLARRRRLSRARA